MIVAAVLVVLVQLQLINSSKTSFLMLFYYRPVVEGQDVEYVLKSKDSFLMIMPSLELTMM